ncbi:MAG: hypothetical protein J4G18_09680 [Anaerolineae bacterium]|nr:hypothetical protein [Anaerolineae bacterium]
MVVDAIRPTLGPVTRTVAVSQALDGKPPELLDKGGLIARRITDLPDPDADMGAMLVRQALWQLYEDCGDGTAAAAVMFQSIYREGLKVITAGGDAMRLRQQLLEGLNLILCRLDHMTMPINGRAQLAQLAECICHDPELADKLGEIFAFIGEYGQLDVRRGHTRAIMHDYMKGMYWKRGAVSRAMLRGGKEADRIVMNDAAILLSDLDIEQVDELVPLLNALMRAGAKSLLLVGAKFSEAVINCILANKKPEEFRIVAVKTPGSTDDERRAHLSDMAVISGAIPLFKAAGDRLATAVGRPAASEGVDPARQPWRSYLGQVRQVWVERTMFGLVSDRDNQQELTEHLADLLELREYATDKEAEEFLGERIGKILGGAAILRIGDALPTRMDNRIAAAKETAKSLRRALSDGILPGGGIALYACRSALEDSADCESDSTRRAAMRILLKALEEPLRTICHNAGFDAAKVAELNGAGSGAGVDSRTGEITDMLEAGLIDVASVQKAALRSAVSGAALALTIDVLLHHAEPQASYTP